MQLYSSRLGEAEIRFAGFAPKRMAHLFSEVDVVDARPAMTTVRSALAMPRLECLFDASGRRIDLTRQTYIDPDVRRLDLLSAKIEKMDAHTAPASIALPSSVTRVREPVLFLGKLQSHYGHALTDGLARAWALAETSRNMPVLFLPLERGVAPEPMRRLLKLLGVEDRRLIAIDEATVFDTVLCPTPAIQWASRIYPAFDEPHRRIAKLLGRGDKGLRGPVYLSRRGLGGGHRPILGEQALEERLRAEGYRIVRPETLVLRDQIEVFQSPAPVIGMIGSALHTLAFRTTSGSKPVGVLTENYVHGRYLLIDAVKNSRATYIDSVRGPEAVQGVNLPLQERTLTIDVEATMAALDLSGLLPRGRRRPAVGSREHPAPYLVRTPVMADAKAKVLHCDNRHDARFDALRSGDTIHVHSDDQTLWSAVVGENQNGIVSAFVVRRLDKAPRRPRDRIGRVRRWIRRRLGLRS